MEVSSIPEDSTAKRTAALEAFADRYSGRAVRLFAVQELLRMKFDALSDSSATSGDYLALRRECVAFEKARKSMKDEAALTEGLTYPADMVKRLDYKKISAEVVSGTILCSYPCGIFRELPYKCRPSTVRRSSAAMWKIRCRTTMSSILSGLYFPFWMTANTG